MARRPCWLPASLKAYCEKAGLDFDALQDPNSDTEQYHFIGKDIVYFHALFWPAMLKFSGKIPDGLNVHGFITVSGEKMSRVVAPVFPRYAT